MAAKLTEQNMRSIYASAKDVYDKKISTTDAVTYLHKFINSSEASLKMYFNIYAAMRKGTVYKMGTGEEFTKFLLESILRENGTEAFRLALSAVKQNSEYRESVNNAQPGLKRACYDAISESGLDIDYDKLPTYNDIPGIKEIHDQTPAINEQVLMTSEDIAILKNAINEPNSKFSNDIMTILSKYQCLSSEKLNLLEDRGECGRLFNSDYAMLVKVSNSETDIDSKIRDRTGRPRYYKIPYKFNEQYYVMTSQLYGAGGTHKDNRTPFYEWILNSLGIEEEEQVSFSVKDSIEKIKSYIASKGFSYGDGLIENFYLSLKSKPFVILAGTSGTGKTRLVKLFAEAAGAIFKLVPVRPDWSDGSDLFGHTDLNGNFIPGPVCDTFNAAIADPDKPVFLCLDEMNLARVEYYLSDFLSVIESREKESGHIVTDGIAQYERGIPENLYVIGTVNMDETTFPFSKKVLDRANTIEFNYVNLMPETTAKESIEPLILPNSFFRTEYLVLATDCMEEKELVEKICTELQALNEKLVKANAHVGYRVRDEIVFYMMNNKKAGDMLTYEQAMDNEIMQKVLPRIQGSSAAIKTLLIDMFKFCMGSSSGIDADTGNVGEQMKNAAASAKYPESARKIGYMMARFEDDGFTSYWL